MDQLLGSRTAPPDGQRSGRTTRYSFARICTAIIWGLGLALTVTGIRVIVGLLPSRAFHNDFGHAYLAGRLLREHGDVYRTPLSEYAQSLGFPFDPLMPQATNPPLLVWLFKPLSVLPPEPAFWIWATVEILSLILVAAVCWHLLKRKLSGQAWLLSFGLLLCSMPVFYHFWFSQVQFFVLALVMVAYVLWQKGHAGAACALLSFAGFLKLYPLALLPMPLLAAKRRSQAYLLGTCALLGLVWFLLPGPGLWTEFFHQALPDLATFSNGRYYNFTISSLVMSLIGSVSGTAISPHVLRAATLVSLGSSTLVLLAAWAISGAALRRSENEAANECLCLLLITSIICSAIAWVHYLVFLTYPLLMIAVESKTAAGRKRAKLIALVLVGLISVNLAGSPLLGTNHLMLRSLVNAHPLFAMVVLWCHFAASLRASTFQARQVVTP
jgi:hypothetical protein